MTALVASIAWSSSFAAGPTPMPYPPAVDPNVTRAIARDLGLTVKQVEAYDVKSAQARSHLPQIREMLGDTWAGGLPASPGRQLS